MPSSSLMSQADPDYIDLPLLVSPPVPAANTAGRWVLYGDTDGTLYVSINGAAYVALATGATGVTLDGAYDFGGAGAGRTITVDAGAVQLNGATAGASTIQGITQTVAANNTGAITGLAINMAAAGTAATPATVDVQALTITGAFSSVAKARGSGLVSITSGYRNATAISCLVRNKQALAGSLVMLGWDSTNYEGLPATSSVLTGVTHMVTLDGQTNVDAATNNVSFVGLRVLVPSTTSASAAGVAVESLSTSTSAGVSVTMSPGSAASVRGVYSYLGANATGSCFYAEFTGGGTTGIVNVVSSSALTLQLQGLRVDLSGVTAGANLVYGAQIIMPSVTNVAAISMRLGGHATAVGLEMETGGSLAVSSANEGRLRYNSGTQTFQVSLNAAAWISLATTGTGGTVTLDNAYNGGRTITVTAAIGSVQFTSTQTSGTIFDINSAATLGGTTYGVNIDLSSVVAGSTQLRGVQITMPAGTSSTSRALHITTIQRSGQAIYVDLGTTVGVVQGVRVDPTNNGITNDSAMFSTVHGVFNNQWYSYYSQSQGGQSATTHYYAEWTPTDRGNALSTGTISGLRAHFAPTSTYYTNNWSNIDVRGLYFTSAPVCSGADPGGIVNYNAWGVYVSHAPTVSGGSAQITTDNFTAFYATITPTSTGGGTRPVKGIQIDMGSACSNTAFGAKFNWGALGGTASGNGVVNINTNVSGTTTGALTMLEIGADTASLTLGASLTGINVNLSTNVVPGSSAAKGVIITIPTSTSISSRGLEVQYAASAGNAIKAQSTSTSGIAAANNVASTFYARRTATITTDQTESADVAYVAHFLQQTQNTLTYSGNVLTLTNIPNTSAPGGTINWTGSIANISNTPLNTFGTINLSGTLLKLTHTPTSASSDTTTGISLTMTPSASAAVTGASITMSANATGKGFLLTHSGTGSTNAATITAAQTSGTILQVTGTGNPSGSFWGAQVDLSGLTANSQTITGVAVSLPASSSSSTSIFSGASAQTAGRGAVLDMTGNLSGTITGLLMAFSGTGGSQIVRGVDISLQSSLSASSRAILVTVATTAAHQMEFASVTDGTYMHIIGPGAGQLRIGAGTATQVAATTAGREVAIIGSNAVAGSSSAGAAAGGTVYITGGNAARLTSGDADGGRVELNPGTGIGAGVPGGVLVGSAVPTFLEVYEMTAPAVATANGARVFAVDNGAGKTVLKVQFQSGAAQTLATEP